ncbi:MAG: hypothetical protein H6719_27345 [Sandaracinaceae bacterium]|nr:hypothetical protein [Sandaracinaceae bacterium]
MRRVALALFLVACGGSPPRMATLDLPDEEDEDAGPRIAGIELPRFPVDVEPDDSELVEGWALTEQALTMPAPRPPTGEEWEVETWADDALGDWMQRRAAAIAEAQRSLEEARQGRADQSVVASLLLGLAYSRFAMDLRGLEVPEVFRDDPERATAYRTAMEAAARPLWERALDAFGSCASVATRAPAHSLDQFRRRCDREGREAAAMLPDRPDADDDDDDER